jgi:hypothetical protein
MATDSGQEAGSVSNPRRGPVEVAKAIGAAVSFVATVTGLVFVLWPTLKPEEPPVTKGATLTNVTLDRISFRQYLERIPLSSTAYRDAQLERPGALVGFNFKINGYRRKHLPLVWRLVDARTGDQLAQSRDLFLTPEANEDRNSWSIWVAVPRGRQRRFFVEIELRGERGNVPLGRVRTDRFEGA